MTDDLINRTRAALDGVTPGPWECNPIGQFGIPNIEDGQRVGMWEIGQCLWPNAKDNARFIAWARGDDSATDGVPGLAAALEAEKAENARLREAVKNARLEALDEAHAACIEERGEWPKFGMVSEGEEGFYDGAQACADAIAALRDKAKEAGDE